MSDTSELTTTVTFKSHGGDREANLNAIAAWMEHSANDQRTPSALARNLRGYAEQLKIVAREWRTMNDKVKALDAVESMIEDARSTLDDALANL